MRRTPGLRPVAVGALLLVPALVLSGCGGKGSSADKPSPSTSTPAAPTPSVDVPSGVALTKPGTDLDFGSAATVPYRPNQKRGTVLRLTVLKATRASMKDFAVYQLDKRTRASTPYYVTVRVKNVGNGDVGGTDVPLWAVNTKNVLIHSSSFTNTFKRCPSNPLPHSFAPSAKVKACLVYLVPKHGSMTSISFRPLQAFAPIVWKGTIHHPATAKKHKSKKKSS